MGKVEVSDEFTDTKISDEAFEDIKKSMDKFEENYSKGNKPASADAMPDFFMDNFRDDEPGTKTRSF